MLTGTKDERHNVIYAGVFPCEKKSEKETNKKTQNTKQKQQRISKT